MSNNIKQITDLLEGYGERERQIALLRYELEHPAQVSAGEMIDSMMFAHGGDTMGGGRHISNKTMYIALNYQEKADRVNTDVVDEISQRLVTLEREQDRLRHYVSLLSERMALVVRRYYFEQRALDNISTELGCSVKTLRRLRSEALSKLAEMYEFTRGLSERP